MKPSVSIVLDQDMTANGVWPELKPENGIKVIQAGELAAMWTAKGVMAGERNPVVALRIDLGGGNVAIVETTARLIQMMAGALRGRYGDL